MKRFGLNCAVSNLSESHTEVSYICWMHIKREKKLWVVFFFLKFLNTYLPKEVSWVATDRKRQVASRWEPWTYTISNSCPFWVSTRMSFVLGVTPKAWSGADASTQMCICWTGWFMVILGWWWVFMPAFCQVGERTHSACSGIRPLYTVLIHQKCLTCLNQEGVCVLHGDVLSNLELNGQNLVLSYHQTTACTLAGFSFAFMPLGR